MFNIGEYTLGTFFGVLISLIISHFLTKNRERQIHKIISFHNAATQFRHSFDDALLNIDQEEHPVHELLRNFFLAHKVAMWHFKYFLSGKARDRFEKTWHEYENCYKENYQKVSVTAAFMSAETEYEIQKRNEYRQHIDNLLKFTM